MLTQTLRPFSFSEIIGQKGIISEMKKRSKTMDFPEVMIFEGESGTGKTTLARIISSLINDPDPIVLDNGVKNPNPESPASKSVLSERYNRDILFFDASSIGKDGVLEIKKLVSSQPMFDKNKIVIIDEAQELTKAGKGVALDLLEKKRKGVYFILCTMDINSFHKSVKSRGQVYKFKPPTSDEILKHLFDISEKIDLPVNEQTQEFYEKGLSLIAENCEESVRTAVQTFERCVYGEFFTEKEIEREFSFLSKEKLSILVQDLLEKKKSVIQEIKDFGEKDFYYMSFKILQEAYLYQTTGYISSTWKSVLANSLDKDKIKELIPLYLEIEKMPYFRTDIFNYYMARFFDNPIKNGVTKLEEKPVSKRQRVPVRG
jgi:DNA polymerase III gamma/tau subunit